MVTGPRPCHLREEWGDGWMGAWGISEMEVGWSGWIISKFEMALISKFEMGPISKFEMAPISKFEMGPISKFEIATI